MILDATAGNRIMWLHKTSENIIYIDFEKRLAVKPTIYTSNEQTPFPPKTFDTILFDPPHNWGDQKGFYSHPDAEGYEKIFGERREIPTYYGWGLHKTRSSLTRHIWQAQKELWRILKDNGLLWFKWCEIEIPIHRILSIFVNWRELMRLFIRSPDQQTTEYQTYWVLMEKKLGEGKQLSL